MPPKKRRLPSRTPENSSGTKHRRVQIASEPVETLDIIPPFQPNSDLSRELPEERKGGQSLLNVLLEIKSDQASLRSSLESLKLPSSKVSGAKPPPVLQSKSLAKQHDFNVSTEAALGDALALLSSDPDRAAEVLQNQRDHIISRNRQLRLGDKFPGALSAMEVLDDLKELEEDPSCALLLSELKKNPVQSLGVSGLNRGQRSFRGNGRGGWGSSGQPFSAGGRFTSGAPYPSTNPFSVPPYPYSSGDIGYFSPSFYSPRPFSQAPYYSSSPPNTMVLSGNRSPRRVVGPCDSCLQYGHLWRQCPNKPANRGGYWGKPASSFYQQGPSSGPRFPALPAPPDQSKEGESSSQ